MEEDYNANLEEVEELGGQLETLAGKTIDIFEFNCYWSHSRLDDVAKSVLMPEPEQCDLTNDEIKDILVHLYDYIGQYGEAVSNYPVPPQLHMGNKYTPSYYLSLYSKLGMLQYNSMRQEEFLNIIADKIIEDRNIPDSRE